MKVTLFFVVASAVMALRKPKKIMQNTNNHTIAVANLSPDSMSVGSTAMTPYISKWGIGDFLNGVSGNLTPACDTLKCCCCIIVVAIVGTCPCVLSLHILAPRVLTMIKGIHQAQQVRLTLASHAYLVVARAIVLLDFLLVVASKGKECFH